MKYVLSFFAFVLGTWFPFMVFLVMMLGVQGDWVYQLDTFFFVGKFALLSGPGFLLAYLVWHSKKSKLIHSIMVIESSFFLSIFFIVAIPGVEFDPNSKVITLLGVLVSVISFFVYNFGLKRIRI